MDVEELIEACIRGLMCLLGILGNNWLGLRSLPGPKTPLRTNEVLFLNLAVSNLITNYLVDLPDAMADFAGRWFLGEAYCGVFTACADLSETSSIFSTMFISVFWYQKLVGSLKRGGARVPLDNLWIVACLLAGSWTIAVVFSIPHFFFVAVEGGNESHVDCVANFPSPAALQTYEVVYLTLANAVPIAGIVFASVQIVITLLRNQKRIKNLSSDAHNATANDLPNKHEKTGGDLKKYEESSRKTQGDPVRGSPDPPLECAQGSGRQNFSQSLQDIHPDLPGVVYSVEGPSDSARSPLYHAEAGENKKVRAPAADPPRPSQPPAKTSGISGHQVRAAKSVVAVATVFLVCWLTHLLLRITSTVHVSYLLVEVASYVAASYTCIIPYIFLYGVKKLSCSSCRG